MGIALARFVGGAAGRAWFIVAEIAAYEMHAAKQASKHIDSQRR